MGLSPKGFCATQQSKQPWPPVGKTNNLGDVVKVTRDATRVTVASSKPMSKGYIKYLTKAYMKKVNLRDWLRVVATDKQTYLLKYYNVNDDEVDEDDDDEDEEED